MWRTFDVGAVVGSLPFRGAVLAAGHDGSSRVVHRARLAATPEQLRRVGPHELVVVTNETLVAAGEGGGALVARLDAAQVAGLAVRLGSSGRLPDELLRTADRLSLPILTFPEIPEIVMALIDRPTSPPWGAGEPSAAVVPSAISNAVFDATGVRLRSVPFTPEKMKAAAGRAA